MIELTEEHKPTLDHQLANLQVSGPVNRLDMVFLSFILHRVGFEAQDSLKNTAFTLTVPCGFPVILLHGATELFLFRGLSHVLHSLSSSIILV